MNISTVLNLVSTIPAFLVHAGALELELTADLKNPHLMQEIEANPYVKSRVAELSLEWRRVESDATGLKKSNILTAFPRATAFLRDAGKLLHDVQGVKRDTQLAAALADMPHLAAEVGVISAQVNAVMAELSELGV